MYKTSASNGNLHETAEDVGGETKSHTLNDVLTVKFAADKCDPSPRLTLTLRAIFQTPNFFGNRFPTTGALAVLSIIASTSSPPSRIGTVRRAVCGEVRPTVGDELLTRFPNPLLILTR